jgi:hypothetical protein
MFTVTNICLLCLLLTEDGTLTPLLGNKAVQAMSLLTINYENIKAVRKRAHIVKVWFVFCNSLISSSFNTLAVIMLQVAPLSS